MYRSYHSTYFIEILRKRTKKLFAASVHLSQTPDCGWRTGLWHKLLSNLKNGNFLTVIYNIHQYIKPRVKYPYPKGLPVKLEQEEAKTYSLCCSHYSSMISNYRSHLTVQAGYSLISLIIQYCLNCYYYSTPTIRLACLTIP